MWQFLKSVSTGRDLGIGTETPPAKSGAHHPFTKFSCGNKETLDAPDARERLLQFYDDHYTSDAMRLVVLGKHSLDELEDWVADKFSNIRAPSAGRRNQEARARLASTGDPWLMYPKVTPKALEKNEINAFRVLPVKDIRKFYMLWPSSGMHMHHISTRPTGI